MKVDRKSVLTDREIEIIEELSHGMSSIEISEHLDISVFTVNSHRKNAMLKINARNTAHLIRKSFEKGFIH